MEMCNSKRKSVGLGPYLFERSSLGAQQRHRVVTCGSDGHAGDPLVQGQHRLGRQRLERRDLQTHRAEVQNVARRLKQGDTS